MLKENLKNTKFSKLARKMYMASQHAALKGIPAVCDLES